MNEKKGNREEWKDVPIEVRDLLRSIVRKLKRSYNPKKVLLFGSYARNRQNPSSDLDLLIIKNTSQTARERWMRVRKILRPYSRRVPISPLVYTEKEMAERLAAGDFFMREILSEGKVLHGG